MTRLEAAMLGTYLQGNTYIHKNGGEMAVTRSKKPSSFPSFHWTRCHIAGVISLDNGTTELLPWLESHNIPIPEVTA